MWPLAFILASEWGNLLALVGLLVFGTVSGSIVGSMVEDIVMKKKS
jgi:large-conductance mechanosensitive channel